jgi:hypothetical protein
MRYQSFHGPAFQRVTAILQIEIRQHEIIFKWVSVGDVRLSSDGQTPERCAASLRICFVKRITGQFSYRLRHIPTGSEQAPASEEPETIIRHDNKAVGYTTCKIEDEGAWNERMHGVWRKDHFGPDEKRVQIRAVDFISTEIGDAPIRPFKHGCRALAPFLQGFPGTRRRQIRSPLPPIETQF